MLSATCFIFFNSTLRAISMSDFILGVIKLVNEVAKLTINSISKLSLLPFFSGDKKMPHHCWIFQGKTMQKTASYYN